MSSLFETANKIHKDLYVDQNKWVPAWKSIRDYFIPMRGLFDGEGANDGKMYDHQRILNDTPIKAIRDLSAGLTSGMSSPSHPWFQLDLEDKEIKKSKKVKQWLQAAQNFLYSVFRKSGTYGMLEWLYFEFGSVATGAVMVLEDEEKTISFRMFTVGEYAIGINNKGIVDKFARAYQCTVKQLVDEFGIDNVSDEVNTMYKNYDYEKLVDVKFLILPNEKRLDSMAKSSKNMPFLSLYWEAKEKGKFLSISGFEEFPVLTPRWSVKNTKCAYGYGPGWEALGEARGLQRMERDKLIATQKIIDPPMLVPSQIQGKFNRTPGGVTYYNVQDGTSESGVKPAYQINIDIAAINASIESSERRIQRQLYTDLFLLITQTQKSGRTATEVSEMTGEKRILGPVLERMDNEIFTPLISRTIAIAARNGLLPEPPEEIQGQELKIEYVSVLAKAQKAALSGSVDQIMAFVINSAEAFPEGLDTIDIDKTVDVYGDMLGTPPDVFRSEAERFKLRQARQQAIQQQQQAEQISGAIQGAKTLSDTQMGGQNALDKIAEMTGANV
jgi:hypothetical protein